MCHQTVSLVARHLEANGLPTLCLGSARDIFAAAAPPRAAFVDYPLGHSAGAPFSPDDQRSVVSAALQAFERIDEPGTIVELANRWQGPATWKSEATDPGKGDTRQVRDTTPRYQFEADRLAAEAAGT